MGVSFAIIIYSLKYRTDIGKREKSLMSEDLRRTHSPYY